ncbi:hypothetical protein BX661DRAFT_215584 [Kickxella alabastrina]|uniref:uncharacterized protein n=1 Tax=Kickxella alabastrina TaxID=61397 RepID=UPI00221E7E8F|nr:uncharacterized protein BX661DRAFT_215584 [Kickxella alabastrina]KAI7834023.1 hypothetical protein BX661DRAFT_215584 [Kickxella alabastrina]
MNQNPFAFFASDANGYPQLPDPMGSNPYLDTRSGLLLKDDLMHTSTMSQDSNDSDSSPSSPSKSKKSDRRTPKSKAEVSERMRRWRSENAEKNRLNDLRCRVYRQARIRFGKDPTPEREAWIQSEIFRRLERRRLREVMKGNGSVPAPTAMTSPTSMAMGLGGHAAGGPLTRSRSTVHPFPMHMNSQSGIPEHAMGFPASPYAMMTGGGMYDSSQQQNQHHHQQQYSHAANGHHGHHQDQGHHQQHAHHQHHQHHHQQQHHQQQQHAHMQHQHNGYLAQTQSYSHAHQQQVQAHHQAQHSQYTHQPQMQPSHQQQSEHHLASNFIGGAQGALPSADLFGNFKFISPQYPGRLMPHQGANNVVSSTHLSATSLYAAQQQQPQQHYMAQQSSHQQQQQQQGSQISGSGNMHTHSVPSHQPHQQHSNSGVDAAAAAAAVAVVADLSNSFQMPQGSGQGMYSYYQDSVPSWEASASSAEMSNGQTNSSPVTPAETIAPGPSQYTLHSVENPVYSMVSSGSHHDQSLSSSAAGNTSAITSLGMVNPIAAANGNALGNTHNEIQRSASSVHGVTDAVSSGNTSISVVSDITDVAAVIGQTDSSSSSAAAAAHYLYGYTASSTSPSLNDVANNLYSLRQISQAGEESMVNGKSFVNGDDSHLGQDSSANGISGAIGSSLEGQHGEIEDMSYSEAQDQTSNDVHRLRHNIVQSPFNINVVSDNLQFQNYS